MDKAAETHSHWSSEGGVCRRIVKLNQVLMKPPSHFQRRSNLPRELEEQEWRGHLFYIQQPFGHTRCECRNSQAWGEPRSSPSVPPPQQLATSHTFGSLRQVDIQ